MTNVVHTFLFTDVEGSTSLWESRAEEMSLALRRHDTIVRAEIERAGGRVFKTVGDAFCAVFASAPSAIGAAVAIQQQLQREPWVGPSLRVRIAVHSGAAEERDNDYFGPTLNRTARLLSAGHGEQILLSDASWVLTKSHLPPGAAVRPLGAHRLKDLSEPFEIYQVCSGSLREDFPPLSTLATRRNNLPIQLTTFVGRDSELEQLERLLRTSRLVTVVGPGGIGKTRLALQAATIVSEDFKDGVFFIDLAPLVDPEAVPTAVAEALNLRDDQSVAMPKLLSDFLASREMLILFDNCEHLLAAVASLVNKLLTSSAQLRVLTTSREGTGVEGEQLLALSSLSLPMNGRSWTVQTVAESEAGRLFTERARAAAPQFALAADNAAAIGEICFRLDGLPLALELAAARTRVMSLEEIARRLDDRFRLLTKGSRTAALARHQTLRGTIDWSYDLLDQPERSLLRRLAVFRGGWTLEAAEAVCACEEVDSDEVLNSLSRLVEQSLVDFVEYPAPRYRMLETIREYALEKLTDSGELEGTEDAHLAWFVSLSEECEPHFWGRDSMLAHARIRADYDNLRSAIDWARGQDDPPEALMRLTSSLVWHWLVRGGTGDATRWTSEAVRRSEGNEGPFRGPVLEAAGWLVSFGAGGATSSTGMERDNLQTAFGLFKASMEHAEKTGEPSRLVRALWGLGDVSGRLGRFEEAREHLERGLRLNSALRGDDSEADWQRVVLLNSLGVAATIAGQDRVAVESFQGAATLARRHELDAAAAGPLANLGIYARAAEDWASAASYFEQALDIYRRMDAPIMYCAMLLLLAQVDTESGHVATAVRRLREARVIDADLDAGQGPTLLWVAAGALFRASRAIDAARLLGGALAAQGPLEPLEASIQERLQVALRSVLGDAAFEEASDEGARLGLKVGLRRMDEILDDLFAAG